MGFLPQIPVLHGALVRLEPLAVSHAADLAMAAEEDRGSYARHQGRAAPPAGPDGAGTLMGIRLFSVVLDCADPHGLARFYAQLLGLAVTRDEPGWAEVGGGQAVRLSFQRIPRYQPPRWPNPAYPPHLHLDFQVGDITAAEATVLALGGRRLPGAEPVPGPPFRVYADPEGHPFCLGWEQVS